MQAVIAGLVVLAGLALGVTGWRGLRATLPRNRFVGVRTPATMADDESFRTGNRVAGPPLMAAAAVAVLGGIAAMAAPSTPVFVVVLTVAVLGTLGLVVAGGMLGSRAAAAVPAPAPTRPSPCAGCACGGPGSSACAR